VFASYEPSKNLGYYPSLFTRPLCFASYELLINVGYCLLSYPVLCSASYEVSKCSKVLFPTGSLGINTQLSLYPTPLLLFLLHFSLPSPIITTSISIIFFRTLFLELINPINLINLIFRNSSCPLQCVRRYSLPRSPTGTCPVPSGRR
jgi:hypothetical protein